MVLLGSGHNVANRDATGVNGYELKHLFGYFEQKLMRDLFVSEPGKIESFDPNTRIASVSVCSKVKQTNGEWVDYGVINGVPVVISGGGGYTVTFPIKKGDGCLLVWQNCSIDQWAQSDTQPLDPRKHHLTDCVALVGLKPPSTKIDYDPDRAVFGNKGPGVACNGNTVELGVSYGEEATERAMLGTKFASAFNTFLVTMAGLPPNPYIAGIIAAVIQLQSDLGTSYTSQRVLIK
jgi:hypothetical protein